MKLSKRQLADIFDDAADFDGSNEQAFDARKALLAGTLEIEGYERFQWVKFDPDDESTYPQRLTRVLVCDKNKNVFESFVLIHNGIREFAGNNVTHWRPLPPPPGKESD